MRSHTRLIFAVVVLALVVCMIIWARGRDHHHGDDIGAFTGVHRVLTSPA